MLQLGDPRLPARFWEKVKESDSGCWLWTGGTNRDGYGRYALNGQMRLAHRVAQGVLVAPIPEGYEVDHLCGVHPCVNPSHFSITTHSENVRRDNPKSANTTCVRGHPWSDENTHWYRGSRYCRTCDRERKRKPRESVT